MQLGVGDTPVSRRHREDTSASLGGRCARRFRLPARRRTRRARPLPACAAASIGPFGDAPRTGAFAAPLAGSTTWPARRRAAHSISRTSSNRSCGTSSLRRVGSARLGEHLALGRLERFVDETLFEQMRLDAFARARHPCSERRLEPRDRHRDALRIEIVGAKERLALLLLLRAAAPGDAAPQLRLQTSHRRVWRAASSNIVRSCAVGVASGTSKSHVPCVFQLDRSRRSVPARLPQRSRSAADAREQHAQREEDLRFVGGATFTENRGFDRNGVAARHEGTCDRRRARARASSPPPHRNGARRARAAIERDRRAARCRAAVVARGIAVDFEQRQTAAATTARVSAVRFPDAVARRRAPPRARDLIRPRSDTHRAAQTPAAPRARARSALACRSVDAAHVEKGETRANVVDERRDGIERIEHLLPQDASAYGIVHGNPRARRGDRLRDRLSGPRPGFARVPVDGQYVPAIETIRDDQRHVAGFAFFVTHDGQRIIGNVNAEQHDGSPPGRV